MKFLFFIFFSLLCACATTTSLDNQEAAETNVMLGLSYLKAQDAQTAFSKLEAAHYADPRNPRVIDALAYYYEWQKDFTKADDLYREALRVDPTSGAAHNNYGAFLCRQEMWAAARAQFILAANSPDYPHPSLAFKNAKKCESRRRKYKTH